MKTVAFQQVQPMVLVATPPLTRLPRFEELSAVEAVPAVSVELFGALDAPAHEQFGRFPAVSRLAVLGGVADDGAPV